MLIHLTYPWTIHDRTLIVLRGCGSMSSEQWPVCLQCSDGARKPEYVIENKLVNELVANITFRKQAIEALKSTEAQLQKACHA